MRLPQYEEWADWWIRLRPLRSFTAPPIIRMRKLLKAALRAYGWRAEDYYQVREGQEMQADGSGI